jgi:hypothetical protein
MAVLTRLELATSAVTGQRSNQLSYSTKPFRTGIVFNILTEMRAEYIYDFEKCKYFFKENTMIL